MLTSFDAITETLVTELLDFNETPDAHVEPTHRLDMHIADVADYADLAFRLENKYNVQIANKDVKPGVLVRELADAIYHEIHHKRRPMRQEVNSHRTRLKGDINEKLILEACHDFNNTPNFFRLTDRPDGDTPAVELGVVNFTNGPDNLGHTNETCLAMVQHRLTAQQAGDFGCLENVEALGHIEKALAALHRRTTARIQQGVGGKHVAHSQEAEKAKEPETAKPSQRVFGNGSDLIIGGTRIPLHDAKTKWKTWSDIEAALKKLNPKPTKAEWAVLEAIAESSAAKNGLTETQAALEKTGSV